MFVYKCISMILAFGMFTQSTLVWTTPMNTEVIPVVEIEQEIVEEPIIEVEEIVVEPIIEEVVPEPPVESIELPLSDAEIDLVALVTMAEAEGESEMGKRLVIDVILNRLDSHRFPNTLDGVIYTKNAFECMWNGRINRCYVRDDIRQLVIEELQSRTNSNIHYFRTNHYHGFGVPVVQEGNHYFSTY